MFKKQESWDGTIDKVVEVVVPQLGDEKEEEQIEQHAHQDLVALSPIKRTATRTPRNLVRGEASKPIDQYTPSP